MITLNRNKGTTIMNQKQMIGNIVANWEWAKLTPL